MDRKGIIAVALAIAVLVLWQIDNSKRVAAQLAEKQKAEELAKLNAPAAPVAPAPGEPAAATPAAPLIEPGAPEQLETFATPKVNYSFTNLGGAIQRAVLTEHQAEGEANVAMNQYGTIAIGALSEKGGGAVRQPFRREEGGVEGEVSYVRTDTRQVQIRKKFTLPKTDAARDPYLTTLEVTFTNVGQQPVAYPEYEVHTGTAGPIHRLDSAQYIGYGWTPGGRFVFKGAATFTQGGMLGMGSHPTSIYEEMRPDPKNPDATWAAVTNQYFASIVVPLDAKGIGAWAHKTDLDAATVGDPAINAKPAADAPRLPAVEGALVMPGFTLEPGKSLVQKFELYTGPREYSRLKALGHGEDEAMNFGTFRIVSKVLLNSMNWLHSVFKSYAAAIIVLTIIIRGLMWPLQNKATQSMKKMQALNPLMTELKAKYKDDPARQNTELMKLYKDYQINPLAGCLPMLVQIPVFFGFFSMLGQAVELRHARFLWVHDLSQMDTVAIIPFLDWPLNILPLCMAVTMLWQMSLSPKSGDAVQQRVFMFMPLIFIFFCYKYASALALYWTVQNLFSVAQLYITRNQTAPVLQKVIAPSKKKR